MSGSYDFPQQDAPGGIADSVAQTQAARDYAANLAANQQEQAGQFIRENGHEVVSGHPPVGIDAGSNAWAAGNAPYATDPTGGPG